MIARYIYNRRRAVDNRKNVSSLAKDHRPFLYQIDLMKKLPVHRSMINTICWNKTGEYILSGSSDGSICTTKPEYMFDYSENYTVLHRIQAPVSVFNAKFLSDTYSSTIISSFLQGPIVVYDINSDNTNKSLFRFNCSRSNTFLAPIPGADSVFLCCDEFMRLFDLRHSKSCDRRNTRCSHPPLLKSDTSMTTLDIHPLNPNLVLVGRYDGLGIVYDLRKIPSIDFSGGRPVEYPNELGGGVAKITVPNMDDKYKHPVASLCYNANGSEILASYLLDYIYLISQDESSRVESIKILPNKTREISELNPHITYDGLTHLTFKMQAIFWGDDCVISGSDCGRILIWEKNTAKLVMALEEADAHLLAANPQFYALASSGINDYIKLWSTQYFRDEPHKLDDEDLDWVVDYNLKWSTDKRFKRGYERDVETARRIPQNDWWG